MTPRVFLLSPATLSGVRGSRILAGEAEAPFMPALLDGGAVPLGDVYAFISSLYYRGKRRYARRFGHRPDGGATVLAITPNRGLLPDDRPVDMEDLHDFARTDIDPADEAYLHPLRKTARELRGDLPEGAEAVLLGSIASGKYLEPLAGVLGERLLFPRTFIGRGDMSRGGVLLRAADAGEELEYVVAQDAERRGSRPPKLQPRRPSSG